MPPKTSQQIMQEMTPYTSTDLPEQINKQVKAAYEGPLNTLLQEGQQAREAYYPSFFNAAQQYGTGAGDMSPAARLSAMLGDSERLGSSYRSNLGIRDYYGTTINDLVNRAMQGVQMGYNTLKDQYQMAFQNEQAEEARRQAAAARASQSSNFDWLKNLLTSTGGGTVNTPATTGASLAARMGLRGGAAGGSTSGLQRGLTAMLPVNQGMKGSLPFNLPFNPVQAPIQTLLNPLIGQYR